MTNFYTYTNRLSEDKDAFALCERLWKNKLEQLLLAEQEFKTVWIEAEDIILADQAYEKLTGINPARFHGHTPPILVSIT